MKWFQFLKIIKNKNIIFYEIDNENVIFYENNKNKTIILCGNDENKNIIYFENNENKKCDIKRLKISRNRKYCYSLLFLLPEVLVLV